MTDEEFTLQETNRERANVARAARYRKGHCGGSGCKLPVDYMTRKEIREMNGELHTNKDYTGQLITLATFRGMSNDDQLRWINSIINRYNVSSACISTSLFGRSKGYLIQHFKACGLWEYVTNMKGYHAEDATFKKAINQWLIKNAEDDQDERARGDETEHRTEQEVVQEVETRSASTTIRDVSTPMVKADFTMHGFDIEKLRAIAMLFGGSEVEVRVSVKQVVSGVAV